MENQIETINMMRPKLKLSDLNPHLMCVLCGGYYIDATTIVECLHSFCRSCIVKHLESSKYCPICEVQVHKTKPLINIRPDKTLQDIVYKLVPGLYASEMKNRRKFYKERPHYMKPNDSESVGEVSDEGKFSINDEYITLSLSYHTSATQGIPEEGFQEIASPDKSEKRYFKCPTAVTVFHLQKLVKAKYELNDNNYKVEVFFKDQPLHKDFTLLDIAYVYLSKNKGALDLTYQIFESVVKRQKVDIKTECETELENVKDEKLEVKPLQKESQLTATPISQAENLQPQPQPQTQTQTQPSDAAPPSDVKLPEAKQAEIPSDVKPQTLHPEKVKENGVKNSEPKEVLLQISESGVMSVSEVENSAIVRTVEDPTPKNVNNQSNTGMSQTEKNKVKIEPDNKEKINRIAPAEPAKYPPKTAKPYKTIRCSPNAWHPVITKEKLRPTLMKNSDEPKKPPKFFKLRNAPRFLGNPSSGVKPMYGETFKEKVTETKKVEKKSTDHTKTLKKILKIDPKTLRPIEKDELSIVPTTPNAPNLLTNPFIPNNNHFLFSDPQLLHPNSGNYSNSSKSDPKPSEKSPGSSKSPLPNGSYSPIRFPGPEYSPNFYPYHPNFPKIPNLFPVNDKMDPFNRGPRLSPFGSLTGFNVAGFHASLPPSISLLFNPHHHIKKINPVSDKNVLNSKEESTKETNKNCDDNSLKINKKNENVNNNTRMLVIDDNCKDKSRKVETDKSKNVAGDNKINKDSKDGKSCKDVRGNANDDKKDKNTIKDVIKNKDVKKDKQEVNDNKQIKEKIDDNSKCNDDNNHIDQGEKKIINDNKEKVENIEKDHEKERKDDKNDNNDQKNDDNIKKDQIEGNEATNNKNNKEDMEVVSETKEDDKKDKKDDNSDMKDDKNDQKNDNKANENDNENKEDNIKSKEDDNKDKITVESCNNTIDDGKCNSSACNDETKTETVNNDNKSVNDDKR